MVLFFARTERGICSVQNKAKEEPLGFILLIFLFCKSRNINAESVRTAWAADVMLSRFFRQTQNVLAFRTTAVNVRFSVAHTVALKAEKCGKLFHQTKKICIFFTSFIEIFRQISEKCPRNDREIDDAYDQLRYTREKEIHDYKNEAYDYQKIIKRVNTVSALHKLPYALAKWSFVFHIKPPGNAQGRQLSRPMCV